MQRDPWLDRWINSLQQRCEGGPVLEVGCGTGDDTAELLAAGLQVVAFDLNADQVARARLKAPSARISVQDVLDRFPLEDSGVPVIVASLSLHYFPWSQTVSLVKRLRNTLASDGLLLARFNSTEDINFGATGHPAIEPGLFMVSGSPKRFFDRSSVLTLFSQEWRILSLEHRVSHKYILAKALWEVAVERAD